MNAYNERNKQCIRFVQGKFNMGGSGALRFCGKGMQLIISRRHPKLAERERNIDTTSGDWSVTVVRREEPSDKIGAPVHSEFTYLAPLEAEIKPRKGELLRFKADSLPLMPEHDEPYKREITWGTAIKLYEYETTVGQSNVLMKDGLLYAIERLLPEIALPVRMHETRGYKGEKERSFETTLAGLVVRLEDGKGDNLEHGFPLSGMLQVGGMNMTTRIYAFKEAKAETYLHDEGVIFIINGQAHGNLPKSIFTRPKAVGLTRLKDSLLVLVDCSSLTAMQREDLFMSSRDRLSKKPIRYELELEIEEQLRENKELRRLQQERREQDVKSKLSEEKPLEEVLSKIFTSSPTLQALFLRGTRLSRPFPSSGGGNSGSGEGVEKGHQLYRGRRHPTYFRIPGIGPGHVFQRHTEDGRRCRIKFETDVENGYFDRATDRGTFNLEFTAAPRQLSKPSYSLTLEDGTAHLNMALPPEVEVGDQITLKTAVQDKTLLRPFVNEIEIAVTEKQAHPPGPKRPRTPQHAGGGESPSGQGIELPPIISVRENDEQWKRHKFTPATACHVISDLVTQDGKDRLQHTFYINIDNLSLKTEMKYSKQDARLLEAKFKYANVLLGLAILHEAEKDGTLKAASKASEERKEKDEETASDVIRRISSAVAPVLIPIIDQLSGLTEEQLEEISKSGEDA